ncbi:MAG TPA: beta-ketoacyl synthase N-terminal-like domain-containing protein [Acetivibrio clariflavus]|mgnify:FL=1|nr:beta-ketoacyl synthase N-terminal-like domain-containing protein [Acetivibrio clariflavus]
MKNKLLLNELDLFEENNDNIRISSEVKNHNINDIAIIGIGAKLPLADNIDEFWENIIKGKDCIREFPDTRKRDIDNFFAHIGQSDENIQYINGAYLDEIDKFDYEFFRLTPIEARLMDPNQRLFLQTAWEAIEDSGYGGKKIIGTNTGVYVGYIGAVEEYKYKQLCSDDSNSFNAASVPGNLSSIIPSRISYLLDLKGPSMIVDTSCSSSLLAVHLACQGIKNGDCDMAIAGGIRLNLVPIVKKEKLGMESSDGKTRSFDDRSDGTGIGEGVIAILLKPLHKALEDKDNIYAVIKGSSINQDGTSIGITAPNVDAQADVIVKAWNEANIDPETISYIETHGTGTKLGDPIEIEGINKAFSRYTDKKQFCAIGSVKANIGHLYQAAGIVGLLKVVLALKNKQIPPLANFCFPNRKINFEQTPVYINDRLTNWECDKLPRRAGVSSFGFSGTNCHVVLEEADRYYDCESLNDCDNFSSQVLTLSAKSEAALMRLVQLHRNYIKKNDRVNLQNICYTANTGRGHYNYRLILKLKDVNDYRNKIEKYANMV